VGSCAVRGRHRRYQKAFDLVPVRSRGSDGGLTGPGCALC
jgi:hypothetical protein